MPVGTKTTETKWWTWNCPGCGREQRIDASCNAKPSGNDSCYGCRSRNRKEQVAKEHEFLVGSEVVEIGVGEHTCDDMDRLRLRANDGRLFDVSCGYGECPSLDVEEVKP